MQSVRGNLMASNVMTDPDTDDQKGGNFFNILPAIPVLMAGADRKSRRQIGQVERLNSLSTNDAIQPALDEILNDIYLNDLLTQGGYDMVALIGGVEREAEVTVLDSTAYDEVLALSGAQSVAPASGEFRVMFLFEAESGEMHPFSAKANAEGKIVEIQEESAISDDLLRKMVSRASTSATRFGARSLQQRDLFSLDA